MDAGDAANSSDSEDSGLPRRSLILLGLLALTIMIPVTLPVPVLRSLVGERFAVSEFLTSIFMSVNMVGAVIAAPIAGAIADRIGKRRYIILGALFLDALFFAGMTLDFPFFVFLGIRFLEGCAHIAALSMLLSVASDLGGESRRGITMGMTGAGMMLGVAIGAPLGGVLGAEDTLRPLYVGSLLLVGAMALAAAILVDPPIRGRRARVVEIWQAVTQNRAVVAPLVFAFADRFTVGFYTTTFSLFASGQHGATPPQIGLWISAFMIPFALLSFPFGMLADRFSKTWLLCVGSATYGVLTASLGFWPTTAMAFGMAVIGISAAVMFVPSMLMTTDLTPPEIRSTALGAFNMAGSLGFILGPMTGGLVSQAIGKAHGQAVGYQAAFGVAGVAEILCVLVALPLLLRLRSQGRTT